MPTTEMSRGGRSGGISSINANVENAGMRIDGINTWVFPLLLLFEGTWPAKITWLAAAIDFLQPLGFILNPNYGWGSIVGSLRDVVFWSQIPLFDPRYNGGLKLLTYAAFLWLLVVFLAVLSAVMAALSSRRSDKKYTLVIGVVRGMVSSVSSWLFVPILHCCAAIMVCTDDHRLWQLDTKCWEAGHVAHFVVCVFVLIVLVPSVLVFRTSVFEILPNGSYMYSKAHTRVDAFETLYKGLMVFLYHVLVGRGKTVSFAVVSAVLSGVMGILHAFLMPHYFRLANSLKVAQMAAVVATSVIFIAVESAGVAEESGSRAVLLLGMLPFAILAGYLLGTARISPRCTQQLTSLEEGRTLRVDKQMEFPRDLPNRSSRFTSMVFTFGAPDTLFGPDRMLPTASETMTWMEAGECSSGAVTVPYISKVYTPTDVEVATRGLVEFIYRMGRDPPQVMLQYAAGVYSKGLLRFMNAPIVKLHYAWFLFILASRPQVAHNFLEKNESVVGNLQSEASMTMKYNTYKLTDRLRRKLNIRERHHEEYGRNAQKMHETVLHQMHQFWLRLMELSVDMVQIGYLASSISENREKGLTQFQRALSDDLQMLTMFADFLEQVMLDKDAAQQCREEIKEMEQEKKQRQMGGSGRKIGASDSGAFVQKLLESISSRKDSFGSAANSTIRKLSLNMNLVFLLLVLLIAGNVVFETFQTSTERSIVNKMDSAGGVRMLSQKAAYEVYDLFLAVDEGQANQTGGGLFDEAVLESQRTIIRTTSHRFADRHNSLTYGDHSTTYKPHRVHYKEPLTEVDLYPYGATSKQEKVVSLWSLGNMITNALHTIDVNLTTVRLRASVDASQATQGGTGSSIDSLLQDPSVLFVTENTPNRIAVAFNRSIAYYEDENLYRLQEAFYALVGLFTASALVITMVYLLFLWYFKKITVSKMITLQLFTLIPYDTLERLSTEAKGRLEIVRRALRKPQSNRSHMHEDLEEEEGDVQIPPNILEELRSKKPGDEVHELTEAQLPYLEMLLANRLEKEMAGEDTEFLNEWVLYLREKFADGRRGGAGFQQAAAASANGPPVLGAQGGSKQVDFVIRAILQAPVPPGILRDRPVRRAPDAEKRRVDFKQARTESEERKKAEAEERRRRKQEANAAREQAEEQAADLAGTDDEDEEDSEAANKKLKAEQRAKKKRKLADENIPSSFWLTNVAVILLAGVALGLTLRVYFQTQNFPDAFSDRNRMVDILQSIDKEHHQLVGDVRTYVQFGDVRFYNRYWDNMHSRKLQKYEDELVTLGVGEEAMRLLADSRKRSESLWETLSAGMAVARMAFGDPSQSGSGLFRDIENHQWTLPEAEILAGQMEYGVIAEYLKASTPAGVIRSPPGQLSQMAHADIASLTIPQRQEMARSFVFSDKLNDDLHYVLNRHEEVIELLGNRTGELSENPDELDTLLIITSVLFFLATAAALYCLWLMCTKVSLSAYGKMRGIFLISASLCVVAGVLPIVFRASINEVEEGLEGELQLLRTTWQQRRHTDLFHENAESYVQFGVETYAASYLSLLANNTVSLNDIHIHMKETPLIEPPLARLRDLFSELAPLWAKLRRREQTAIALTASATETTNQVMVDMMNGWEFNKTKEEDYQNAFFRYPQCKSAFLSCVMAPYTDWQADHRDPPLLQMEKARDTIASREHWDLSTQVNNMIDGEFGNLMGLLRDELEERKGSLHDGSDTLLAVVSVVSGVVLVLASGLMAYILIQLAEANQQAKSKVDNPLFRTLLFRCRLSLGAVGMLTAVIFIVQMVAVSSTRDFAVNMNLASAREWLVARSMVYAHRLVTGTQQQKAEAKVGIEETIQHIDRYRSELYFGEDLDSGGYNEVGRVKSQDEYMFGPDALKDAELERYYRDKCSSVPSWFVPQTTGATNLPAYSHPDSKINMPLDMALRRWSSSLQELVVRCTEGGQVTSNGQTGTQLCTSILDDLRKRQVGPLIEALEHSGDLYEQKALDSIDLYSLAAKVVFGLTMFTIIVLYIRVFRRMVSSLTDEDHGTKSMLKMIPQDVRESVPAISEYLETGKVDNTDQLQKNFEQSQKLLANILPANISHRLKSGENPIADAHQNITICFTDFCGFTSIASKLNAVEIVTFLNEVFIEFDLIVEMYELEKIKTIGDAYFLAGGLDPNITDHSLRCVEAALQMFCALDEHNQKHPDRPPLRMRLGCHSGPAVAGCIGVKKVAYDLWGDTVTMAEECESGGVPDHVHLSKWVKASIEDYYVFQPRGDSGGKVKFPSFLIVGRKRPTPYMHVIRQAEGLKRDMIANGKW
eukprot:Hpha_TRINITY_DN16140_c0_g7::TRINITY_DN16140_c0_g7_i2::g.8627::m.8627